MHNSVSTENTCVKRKYTLTETVKGEKQPHPPLKQWSLPPPPGTAKYTRQTVHVGDVTNTRPTSGSAKYQVSATDPHTQKSAVIPRTNKQTQKSKGGLSANTLTTTLSVIGTGRIQAVRSREWPVPAASGGVASRVSGQGVAESTYRKCQLTAVRQTVTGEVNKQWCSRGVTRVSQPGRWQSVAGRPSRPNFPCGIAATRKYTKADSAHMMKRRLHKDKVGAAMCPYGRTCAGAW